MSRHTFVRRASWIGVAGGIAGFLLGTRDLIVGPRAAVTQLSYPSSPDEVWWTACVLALVHAAAAVGTVGVLKSDAPSGKPSRAGLGVAAGAFAVMILGELAYIPFKDAAADSTAGMAISGVLGAAAVVAGLGLTTAGIGTLRHRTWSAWRRPMPLIVGLWPLVVVTPVFLTIGWSEWPLLGWQALLTGMSAATLAELGNMGATSDRSAAAAGRT